MKNEKLNTWFVEFKRLNGLTNENLSEMFEIKIKQNNSAYYRHLRTLKKIVEAKFIDPATEVMTNAKCANTKEGKFKPKGKYEYDVFYTLDGEMMTGHTRGDNQKHARENFFKEYEKRAKSLHFQRYLK